VLQFYAMMFRVLILCIVLVMAACDRAPVPPVSATQPVSEAITALEFRQIAALNVGRPTHIAMDAAGNIYWVQEDDESEDVLFVMSRDGISRSTLLTDVRILAAVDARGGQGSIQSIAIDLQGRVLFYFAGGKGARIIAFVGRFDLQSGNIDVLLDADALAKSSGMGISLELARAHLMLTPEHLLILLRHADQGTLLQCDPDSPATSVHKVEVRDDASAFDLKDPGLLLSKQLDGTLTMVDLHLAKVWQVHLGKPWTELMTLGGVPREISEPYVDDQLLMIFVAGGDPIQPVGSTEYFPRPVHNQFPAMLLKEGSMLRAINADNWMCSVGIAPEKLRISTLLKDPTEQSWIAYDIPSGTILRIRPTNRQ